MNEDNSREKEAVWIENEHKIKSCWPRNVAEKLIRKNYGWGFAVPDEVPAQKQYPLGMGEFTETGLRRRLAAAESQKLAAERPVEEKKEEANATALDDLRVQAKRLKIGNYWSKSKERLVKEIAEA